MSFATDLDALKNAINSYATLVKNKLALMMLASDKGANNGVAPLVNGYVPAQYLPSYVDDVLEYNGYANFPATGETGKIYVDISVPNANAYRWTGSGYLQINNHVSNADAAVTATRLVTARNITATGDASWTVSFSGSADASGVLTVTKINGISLAGLGTGLMKNTTGTGVPVIATPGTDYIAPGGALGTPASGNLANCTFPILNQNTTGDAAYATTAGTAQSLNAANAYQAGGLGVGTAPSGTMGEIRATGNITGNYSDERLKEKTGDITNALDKIEQLKAFTYIENDLARSFGFNTNRLMVGLSAQEVLNIQPEAVFPAPFDIGKNEDGTEYSKSGNYYLTVQYERLVPLLVAAIKELRKEINQLKGN